MRLNEFALFLERCWACEQVILGFFRFSCFPVGSKFGPFGEVRAGCHQTIMATGLEAYCIICIVRQTAQTAYGQKLRFSKGVVFGRIVCKVQT